MEETTTTTPTTNVVRVCVEAEDHPICGWIAIVTSLADKTDNLQVTGGLQPIAVMFHLVHVTAQKMQQRWPNTKFHIESCDVKDNDDCGSLKTLLEQELEEMKC
jgi:hypothetical protein